MMIYKFLPFVLLLSLYACGQATDNPSVAGETVATTERTGQVYQDISVVEFAEKIGGENTVLLDVRTPAETAGGVIEGAIEMDYRSPDFADQLKSLDPSKTYLVYCASGGRSSKTCNMLSEAGFDKVYNLKGGYAAWKQ